jgi:hypothetical protein
LEEHSHRPRELRPTEPEVAADIKGT